MSDECWQETPCRALWLAVLLQAKEDLRYEPLDSVDFNAAAAFFTSGGEWAVSRRDIGELLGIDPSALRRLGRTWLAERRVSEGLPPEAPAAPRAPPVPAVKPHLVYTPPVFRPEPAAPPEPRRARRGRAWSYNPFNPLLRRA